MVHACEVALVDLAGEHLERAIGSASLFGAAGDLLGPVALVVTAALGWSWRVPFVVGAGVCTAYGVWLATLPLPPPRPADGVHASAFRGARSLLRDPSIWRFGLVAVLFVQLDEAYLAFVIAYLRRGQHLTAAWATLTGSAIVVGAIVGFATIAHGGRGHGSASGALRTTAAVLFASCLGIALLPGPVPVALCGLAFGMASARFYVVFHTALLRYRPGRAGSVTAVVGNLEMLGFGFPVAIGAIADAHGLRAGLVVYAAVPAVLVVVAGASRARPRRRAQDLHGGSEHRAFEREQEPLVVDAAAVAGEAVVAADHTVTRHDDRDRVAAVRLTDGAHRVRSADRARDLAVARRLAVGNRRAARSTPRAGTSVPSGASASSNSRRVPAKYSSSWRTVSAITPYGARTRRVASTSRRPSTLRTRARQRRSRSSATSVSVPTGVGTCSRCAS